MRKENGFTIVELMIATAVFSIVLMLCAYAIIHVGRMYYRGVITNRTQDTSRKVVDDISRAIQFSSFTDVQNSTNDFPDATGVQALCLGGVRYTYSTQHYLGENTSESLQHVLWKDRIPEGSDCEPLNLSLANPNDTPDVQDGTDGVELLGDNMRVPRIEITEDDAVWTVAVRIVHGDDEGLFEDGNNFGICKGGTATGQFCAVSELTTSVTKRL